MCDAGCTNFFEREYIKILRKGAVILKGNRYYRTGLWKVPLKNGRKGKQHMNVVPTRLAKNVHQTSSQAELVKYLHATSFIPMVATWVKAIENVLFVTWTGLAVKNVKKYS